MNNGAASVVLATSFCPPYRRPLFDRLRNDPRWSRATVALEVRQETGRHWSEVELGQPDESVFCLTIPRWARHPDGRYRERRDLRIPVGLLLVLWRHRPRVIISAELGLRSGLAVLLARLWRGSVVLWICVTPETERGRTRLTRSWRRWLLHRTGAIIVNGQAGEAYVRALAPESNAVRAGAVFHVPYTVYNERYWRGSVPLRKPGERLRLLLVGQLSRRKGIAELLRALSAAPDVLAKLDLRVAGEGPLRPELERAFGQLSDQGLVSQVLGHVDWEQLPGVYGAAHGILFPTLDDEWGIVVNEAMAAGLPVFASRYSGAAVELVRPGQTGLLFDPTSLEDFVATLRRVVALSPAELHAMGERGREVVARYTYDRAYGEMAKAIEECARAQSRTHA